MQEKRHRAVTQRREALIQDDQMWKKFGLIKWDVIRDRRDKMMQVLGFHQDCLIRQRAFKAHFICIQTFGKILENMQICR